jgi:4-hydroxythreonine-4-phosphate dehydrogenase
MINPPIQSRPLHIPTVIVSAGDPAGIGPEITLRALAAPDVADTANFLVAGAAKQLTMLGEEMSLPVPSIVDVQAASDFPPGRPSREGGAAAVAFASAAVDVILRGAADALVTAPVSKGALKLAGYPWPGQTEMLADMCKSSDVRVLLMGEKLRVVHVTAHRSLANAIDAVTRERVRRTIEMASDIGERLVGHRPKVAVTGLNPHAGEGGILGTEDGDIVAPAVSDTNALGLNVTGPLSADTLFPRAAAGEFDIVVAMYHDQGHIPVKLLAANAAVAATLGLPFIRTSPDHGPAFDLAGKGLASPASMKAALQAAARIAASEVLGE